MSHKERPQLRNTIHLPPAVRDAVAALKLYGHVRLEIQARPCVSCLGEGAVATLPRMIGATGDRVLCVSCNGSGIYLLVELHTCGDPEDRIR